MLTLYLPKRRQGSQPPGACKRFIGAPAMKRPKSPQKIPYHKPFNTLSESWWRRLIIPKRVFGVFSIPFAVFRMKPPKEDAGEQDNQPNHATDAKGVSRLR